MKKILLFTISSILLINIFSLTVFAQDNQNQQNGQQNQSEEAAFKCEDVSTAGEGFFTILEEPLITKSQPPNNLLCFRVCGIEAQDGKRVCEIMSSCPSDPNKTCKRIQVIKSESGAGLLYNYVGLIYKWAAGTVGIISVFVMVYSGIGIMTAGGDSGAIENHKKRIVQSLFGLVVLFLSGLILYTVNPTFFV